MARDDLEIDVLFAVVVKANPRHLVLCRELLQIEARIAAAAGKQAVATVG